MLQLFSVDELGKNINIIKILKTQTHYISRDLIFEQLDIVFLSEFDRFVQILVYTFVSWT